jgi:MFS family permease
MTRLFGWLAEAPAASRRALLAASLGWMLDSFDLVLYALVLPSIMVDLHLTKTLAGLLGSVTLVAGAVGGILFGIAADRWGRTRALIGSILLYSVFTAACGVAQGFVSLLVFRICLGFGMGGEWATGATLVSETWPAKHRDKALALMQSAFAVGYGLAAFVVFLLKPLVGWRGVFFAGLVPALLTIWIRRSIREPETWHAAKNAVEPHSQGFRALFRPPLRSKTIALTAMNACCLFAWWGFNLWVPSYLSLSVASGGIGFSARTMTVVLITMQVGMWIGYISFGYLATAFGRTRVYVSFLLIAAMLLVLFSRAHTPVLLLLLGPLLACTATGYFSGFAAVTADTFPSAIRATGQGFTYNLGRLASAAAPFIAGSMAQRHGFASAFYLDAAAFVAAAAMWIFLRSTPHTPVNHAPLHLNDGQLIP